MSRKFNLTKKQHDALTFIKGYIEEHKIAPSYDEIADALGLKSKSGVNRLTLSLKERGWIDFLPNASRSITIIESEGMAS